MSKGSKIENRRLLLKRSFFNTISVWAWHFGLDDPEYAFSFQYDEGYYLIITIHRLRILISGSKLHMRWFLQYRKIKPKVKTLIDSDKTSLFGWKIDLLRWRDFTWRFTFRLYNDIDGDSREKGVFIAINRYDLFVFRSKSKVK